MSFSVPAGNVLVFSSSDGVVLDVPTISPITRSITHGTAAESLDR